MNEIVKQQDLCYPYTFAQRKPLLHDGVLFIPRHYAAHTEWQENLFAGQSSVFIEFCSGNGEWIIEKAKQNPEIYWVAVERKFDRVRKIWAKSKRLNVKNLLIVAGDAEIFAEYYVPKESIEQIFINFPDPWPKGRHAKHRLVQPPFAEIMALCMKEGGLLTMVTDDLPYRNQMEEVASGQEGLEQVVEANENYGSSYFQRLWIEKGRDIHHLRFRKK